MSLYPWVNKTGKISLGHPEIINESFMDIKNYEVLVKSKVLPQKRFACTRPIYNLNELSLMVKQSSQETEWLFKRNKLKSSIRVESGFGNTTYCIWPDSFSYLDWQSTNPMCRRLHTPVKPH